MWLAHLDKNRHNELMRIFGKYRSLKVTHSAMNGSAGQDCIVVTGAPRTGTHLVNAVLSWDPRVTPVLTEATPLTILAQAYQRILKHIEIFPDVYFGDKTFPRASIARDIYKLTQHLTNKYNSDICIYRAPVLATLLPDLLELFALSGLKTHFLLTIRTPHDSIASFLEAQLRRGDITEISDEQIAKASRQYFVAYYKPLLSIKHDKNISIVQYESLVTDPEAVAQRLSEKLDLELSDFSPDSLWPRVHPAFGNDTDILKPWLTDMYGGPVSNQRIGRHQSILTSSQTTLIDEICKKFYQAVVRRAI